MGFELRYIGVDDPAYVEAKEVRYACLYGEWGLPRELVEDTDGRVYEHLIAEEDGRVVGYARIHLENGASQVYQLCVTSEMRGQGIAVALMVELMDRARREGRADVRLDAREHVIGSTSSSGFAARARSSSRRALTPPI